MGGNALSNPSVRLQKTEFDAVSTRCVNLLRQALPGQRVEALGSYRLKDSFGDCDILIESNASYDPEKAALAIGAVEVVRNGPVTSVGVDIVTRGVFQVDLIKSDAASFDFSLNYFGRADAGNLLGRIFHAMGTVLRHDGLYYYVHSPEHDNHKFRELLLTQDFGYALKFIGLDPSFYAEGFDAPEDIFAYIAASPFFNPDIYLLHNRNAKSRVRDKKRTMYMNFLSWCEGNPKLDAFAFPGDKRQWLGVLFEWFPVFKQQYEKANDDLARLKLIRGKFNGRIVSQITGLQGKELGALMSDLRSAFGGDSKLNDFVLNASGKDIEDFVLLAFDRLHASSFDQSKQREKFAGNR